MAIVTVGSINIDHVYRVDRFARPGETMLTGDHAAGLGGKGANQSIAAARAGAEVRHVGAVGADGGWIVDRLAAEGIDVSGIATVSDATGHAVIQVDAAGENVILVYSGANQALERAGIEAVVATMAPRDWLLFQNETNLTAEIAKIGRAAGVRVAYSAAPFLPEKALPLLATVDLICVNALEAAVLAESFGGDLDAIPVEKLLVTKGADGVAYRDGAMRWSVESFPVNPVDTTGAGDTFLGFFLAALDKGLDAKTALRQASAAAAIQVTRPGAADAIPTAGEVDAFLNSEARA